MGHPAFRMLVEILAVFDFLVAGFAKHIVVLQKCRLARVVGAPGGALALLAHWFSVVTAPLRELQPTHRKDAFMVFVVGDVAALHAHRRVEIDPFFHFYSCFFPPHTSAPSSTVPIIRPSTNAMRQSQFMFSLPVHLPGSRHTSGQFPAQSRRSPRTRSGQALPEVHLLA